MNDYYQVRIDLHPCNEDTTDYMAALLGDIDYETFVPDSEGLTAYVKAELFDANALEQAVSELPFNCSSSLSHTLVPGQDWNVEWEKNYFQPIIISGNRGDNAVVIHSSFHTDIPNAKYDIVIDPKMAFGTGHHATTTLIISRLLEMNLKDKTLIDMGTGTGILAILAAMRGASNVSGVEIDEFAYQNAIENVKLNNHSEINLLLGDASALLKLPKADVLLANINRNIILNDMAAYVDALKPDGIILLSGFYETDIPILLEAAQSLGLIEKDRSTRGDNWACLSLKHL